MSGLSLACAFIVWIHGSLQKDEERSETRPRVAWSSLLRRPFLLSMLSSMVVRTFVISGLVSFLAKWIALRFETVSPETANYIVGGVAIPGSLVGLFLSGGLVYRFRMPISSMLWLSLGSSVLMTCLVPFFLVPVLSVFVLTLFFLQIFFFSCDTLLPIALLKWVGHSDFEGPVMSIQLFVVRIFGSIPGPIFIGWLFDQQCTEKDRGTCILYNVDPLHNRMVGWMASLAFLSCLALALSVKWKARQTTVDPPLVSISPSTDEKEVSPEAFEEIPFE
jgi:hypothetical protein